MALRLHLWSSDPMLVEANVLLDVLYDGTVYENQITETTLGMLSMGLLAVSILTTERWLRRPGNDSYTYSSHKDFYWDFEHPIQDTCKI